MSNRSASTWLGIAFAFMASAAIAFSADVTGDYSAQVAPAVRALVAGDLAGFFDLQPVYGSVSVLVQAPFAAAAVHLGDGGDLLLYRLALLPCLLAVGLVGVVLGRAMAERGQPPIVCAAACLLALVNPATFGAVENGHPEELLAGALVVGALLAGLRGRGIWAAIMLGVAISTKQWALLAAVPVLLTIARGCRARLALTAAAVTCALTLPLAVTNSEKFTANNRAAQGASPTASRFSVWWPVSSVRKEVVHVGEETSVVTRHRLPRSLAGIARPLIVVLALALALLYARRSDGRPPEDVFALLALVLLLRCVLDPLNNSYYHVPFVLSLLAWEGLRMAGLPVLTLASAAALWATFEQFLLTEPLLNNAFYLGWTMVLAAWLAASLYAPGFVRRLQERVPKRLPMVPVGRDSLPARNA